LEAADEVARQLRLRDLAGLIVIDFIDMDERKNNAAVEKRMKDKLKTDRARIQVSRISGFGLMEMSRQRLRPGMIEATTQPCPSCHGTGLIRSDDNLALNILRQIEEEGVRRRSREVLVRCPVGISNFLMNQKREHVAQIELRYGLSVRIEGDPLLISPDFALEKFKTATRAVPEAVAPVVSVDSSIMDDIDGAAEADPDELPNEEADADAAPARGRSNDGAEDGDGEDRPKKRRRRRRSRSRGGRGRNGGDDSSENGAEDGEATEEAVAAPTAPAVDASGEGDTEEKPKPKRTRRPRKSAEAATDADAPAEGVAQVDAPAEAEPEDAPKPKRVRKSRAKKVDAAPEDATPEAEAEAPAAEEEAKPKRTRSRKPKAEPAPEPVAAAVATPEPEPAPAPTPEPAEAEAAPADDKPKRKGWWSLGR
ncbi:MAG: ribonuclease E/G, partial [Roseovarius sp.]